MSSVDHTRSTGLQRLLLVLSTRVAPARTTLLVAGPGLGRSSRVPLRVGVALVLARLLGLSVARRPLNTHNVHNVLYHVNIETVKLLQEKLMKWIIFN